MPAGTSSSSACATFSCGNGMLMPPVSPTAWKSSVPDAVIAATAGSPMMLASVIRYGWSPVGGGSGSKG